MTTHRPTDADYDAMAADYAANPLRADEVIGPIEHTGAILRMGRPAKDSGAGKTPSTTVRLPADINVGVDARAAADNVKSAEIIRRAVVEYLERHPA